VKRTTPNPDVFDGCRTAPALDVPLHEPNEIDEEAIGGCGCQGETSERRVQTRVSRAPGRLRIVQGTDLEATDMTIRAVLSLA
jgi:hypothetical protein